VHNNATYIAAEEIAKSLTVTNDTAERGVALMQQYNGLLSKTEEQTQFIIQVVSEHRKRFPMLAKVRWMKVWTTICNLLSLYKSTFPYYMLFCTCASVHNSFALLLWHFMSNLLLHSTLFREINKKCQTTKTQEN
jgi:hypothetical protein